MIETLYQGESVRVFLRLTSGDELNFRLASNQPGRSQLRPPGAKGGCCWRC
ncbi:MAG: hypothetical protein ACK4NH_06000 [Gemmobacter sp.]